MADRGISRILIGVDESDSTHLAIEHVLEVFSAAETKPSILLLHILEQPLPTGIEFVDPTMVWEAGGLTARTPAIDAEGIAAQKKTAEQRVRPLVQSFLDAGWSESDVTCRVVEGGYSRAAVAELLAFEARENTVDIVVIGRTRHGKLHEALIKSTGQRLVNQLRRITIWVVGGPPPGE